jgi:hypothetical protein
MNILSEEEIENLKKENPKKRIVRIFFLIAGISIFSLGIIFFFLGVDFDLIILDLNFSFVIDILLVIIGMILISKFYIASYYIRENSIVLKKVRDLREPITKNIRFNSFAFTRLIAALLLIVGGILSLSVFGTDVGHEVPYGSAIFLGGPSWFYLTGLPAIGFGFGLFLYFFLSPFRGIFSKSENFYYFYEIRPGFPWLTEIPKKDVEMMRYQDNYLGPKLTWIPALFPFIVMQLMTSISLFSSERAAPEFTLSWTFLTITILEIISLIILVFFQQRYFEIATDSRLYEMWFSPFRIKNRKNFDKEFSRFLGLNLESRNEASSKYSLEDINKNHISLFNLFFGLFLIILSLIMFNFMIMFGPLFWWLALIYGFILITKSLSYDFNKKDGDSFEYNPNTRKFVFKRMLLFKFQTYSAFDVKELNVKKWFRKLDSFDVIFILGLILFSSLQQGFGWLVADSLSLIADNTISSIILVLLIFIIILYICLPVDIIEIITKTITYQIPISKKAKNDLFLKSYLLNLKRSLRLLATKEFRKTFYLRLGIVLSIIFGVFIYLLIFFTILF